jgi:hypothetical protein
MVAMGNPVLASPFKDLGADPVVLLGAEERRRRQAAVNALMVIGWDNAAREILYADGYGCDDDLEILVNGLEIGRSRTERTPAERDRFAAAIREVKAIMGAP